MSEQQNQKETPKVSTRHSLYFLNSDSPLTVVDPKAVVELTDRVVFTMANGQIRVFREHIREWHEMEFLRPEKKEGKQ